MPPKRTANARPRQLSVEVGGISSDLNMDSDMEGDFDPVQAATELKRIIDGVWHHPVPSSFHRILTN